MTISGGANTNTDDDDNEQNNVPSPRVGPPDCSSTSTSTTSETTISVSPTSIDSSSSTTSVPETATGNETTNEGSQPKTIIKTLAIKTLTSRSSPPPAPQVGDPQELKVTSNSNKMMVHNETSSSSVLEGDETNSSTSSYRRYKNSPFGLRNHFMAMPDVNLATREPIEDYADVETHHRQKLARHSASDCDLSVIAAGSSLELPDEDHHQHLEHNNTEWGPLDHHHQQHLHHHVYHLNGSKPPPPTPPPPPSSSQPPPQITTKQPSGLPPLRKLAGVLPAGDAGLDASRCNSKANHHQNSQNQHDCYEPDHHKQHHHHHNHQRHFTDNLIDHDTSGHQDHNWDSNSLLIRFSSIMYATFLVILGCILHISELRQKSKNSSDHIYTTVVALVGISWLLFLQADLQRYKRYASKYILIESIFNDHHHHHHRRGRRGKQGKYQLTHNQLDPTARSSSSVSTTSSSAASLINDRLSMNTEVIFKKTAYKMYQQRAAHADHYRRYQQHQQQQHKRMANGNGNNYKLSSSSSLAGSSSAASDDLFVQAMRDESTKGRHPRTGLMSSQGGQYHGGQDTPTTSDVGGHHHQLVPAYKFLHGKMGANFYLKCGMAAFCFGHVIHEGLRFGQQLYFFSTNNQHCRDSAALVAHLVTPLYSFYQLFMMFKYSNLVINRHKILARFGLMHIIGTSVTFWFRTILEEAYEDFVHKMDYFRTQNKPLMMLGQHSIDLARPSTPPAAPASQQEQANNVVVAVGPSVVAPSLMDLLTSTLAASLDQPMDTSSSTTTTTNKKAANPASGWPQRATAGSGQQLLMSPQLNTTNNNNNNNNISLAQSARLLTALMSSPISATITPQLVRHLPDSYACAQNTLLTTKSMNALPYLYPFTIEYNLLLAATFLSLYFNIGKIGGGAGGKDHHDPASCRPFVVGPNGLLPGSVVGGSVVGGCPPLDSRHGGAPKSASLVGGAAGGQLLEASDHSNMMMLHQRQQQGNSLNQHQQQHQLAAAPNHSEDHLAQEYKSNFVVNADCHSANKGLFCGFFVLLVTLVTIVIFFVTINKPSHLQLGIKINLIQEATLTALLLLVTLAGFKQIVKLNRNPYLSNKVTTDDVLMLIPLPFFFLHSLLAFRAETASFYSQVGPPQLLAVNNSGNNSPILLVGGNDSPFNATRLVGQSPVFSPTGASQDGLLLVGQPAGGQQVDNRSARGLNSSSKTATTTTTTTATSSKHQTDHFKLLTIALNVAVMVEVLVQTNFIIDGLKRCSESRYLRFKKPGRELITFAILLNITYWIVATFETKSVEQYKTEIEYYGPLPYMFISHTTLPVMLFYRYHSSVCLAEIWNRAYKPPKRR